MKEDRRHETPPIKRYDKQTATGTAHPHHHSQGTCEAHCPGCGARLTDMAACWADPNGLNGLRQRNRQPHPAP